MVLCDRMEKLEMRISSEAERILRDAAAVRQKSLSEFVLDSAMARADEALLKRRTLRLSGEEWDAFLTAQAARTPHHPRMERLLKTPSIFD